MSRPWTSIVGGRLFRRKYKDHSISGYAFSAAVLEPRLLRLLFNVDVPRSFRGRSDRENHFTTRSQRRVSLFLRLAPHTSAIPVILYGPHTTENNGTRLLR